MADEALSAATGRPEQARAAGQSPEDSLLPLCASTSLANGRRGLRFDVQFRSEKVPAFVVRHADVAVGYLNRCAHIAMELDWAPGEFFEPAGEFLVCATHGAVYDPASGACAGGACAGRGNLRPLSIVERDGTVYWQPDAEAQPLPPKPPTPTPPPTPPAGPASEPSAQQ